MRIGKDRRVFDYNCLVERSVLVTRTCALALTDLPHGIVLIPMGKVVTALEANSVT
jgi:hypothetical protein